MAPLRDGVGVTSIQILNAIGTGGGPFKCAKGGERRFFFVEGHRKKSPGGREEQLYLEAPQNGKAIEKGSNRSSSKKPQEGKRRDLHGF